MDSKRTAAAAFVFLVVGLAVSPPSSAQVPTTVAGFTPGSFRTTESGGAEYSIALRVPPGIGGMEPKLAVGYSSQGGGGLLGVGWGLSGLSVIHRCGKTIVQDGVNAGVTYTIEDRYCLDGTRLVAVNGAYGAHGTEYRTERESFTKIVSFGTAGNGPASFKVWTKAGQILEYGATEDSRIEGQGKSSVRIWAVNRLSDTKGNYVTVEYTEDEPNGDYRPARINYTGNTAASLLPFDSVRFSYGPRNDANPMHVGGSIIKVTQRLSKVTTFVGETPVTDYRLGYDQGGVQGASRLVNFTECNGAGTECFSPTTMSWQASSGQTGFAPASNWGRSFGFASFVADANGDGLGDLIYSVDEGNIFVAYSSGASFGLPISVGSAPFRCVFAGDQSCNGGYSIFAVGDVNGDGRADIVMGNGPVYLSTGGGFTNAGNWGRAFGIAAFIADANGDGLGDLIYTVDEGNIYVAYSTGAGFGAPSFVGSAPFRCVFAGDQACNGGYSTFAAGDVDGDGRADIVMGNGQVYLSTGTGFTNAGNWGRSFNVAAFIADANGDGLGDLIHTADEGNVFVAYSAGVSFAFPSFVGSAPFRCVFAADQGCNGGYSMLAAGDVNGDGRADIVMGNGLTNVATAPTADSLSRVADGLGAEVLFEHKPLTDTSVYAVDSGSVWPVRDVLRQGPLNVVSSMSASNGIGGHRRTDYFYRGAKAHMRGGGFLGFREIKATDAATGIESVGTFRQTYPFHGLPLQTLRRQSSGTLIAQSDNTWTDVGLSTAPGSGGSYHKIEFGQIVERSYELTGVLISTVTTTNQNIDAFGNVGIVTVGTADGFVKTTTNTYSNDTANWFLGRLSRAQVTSTIPDPPMSQTRTSGFAYEPTSGLLIKEIVEPDQSSFCLVTQYDLDGFGNRISATTRNCSGVPGEAAAPAGDAFFTPRQSESGHAGAMVTIGTASFTYPNGQFATSSRNALGHPESRQFDPRFGVAVSLTGPNALTTRWSYDTFGRKTREDRADDTFTTWSYAACSACPAHGRIQVSESSTGAPTKTTYFDALNREIRTEVQGFDGMLARKDTEYDALGRTRRTSLPYFGAAAKWVCFENDILGRVKTEWHPTDTDNNSGCNSVSKTTIAYNGLTTIVTNALQQTETRVKNSQGQLIRVTRQ